MRVETDFDLPNKLAIALSLVSFAPYTGGNFSGTFRLVFSSMDTGEVLGHFPRESVLTLYTTRVTLLDDGTLVNWSAGIPFHGTGTVTIVSNWHDTAQWYK